MIKFWILLKLYISNFIKGQKYKGSAYCSIPLLILNHFTNIQVPEENTALFHFALSTLIFSLALFGAIFNLFLTVCVLYYKNKYDLELKFKNYPLIVKIIKFYEKASYVGIIYEVAATLFFVVLLILISLGMILIVTKLI
jgi:hypothetical protein